MRKTTPLLTKDKITLMLSMIPFLLEHGPTPIVDLAAHFEVDAATVRSIVRFFGTAGVPGETATYQDEDLFDIDWDALDELDEAVLVRTVVVDDHPRFSPREVTALLAGLQYLRNVPGVAKDVEVQALVQKLTSASTQTAARVEIEPSLVPQDLQHVRHALEEQRSLSFGYRDSNGSLSDRVVLPTRVESVDDVWYLRAWCTARKAMRLFRVDRMVNVQLGSPKHAFEHPDLSAEQGESQALYTASEKAIEVSFTAAQSRIDALRPFDVTVGEPHNTVLLADVRRAARLAAAAPGLVEVLAPPAARLAVAKWADHALAQYDV